MGKTGRLQTSSKQRQEQGPSCAARIRKLLSYKIKVTGFFSRYRQQIIPSKPKLASKSIALGLVRKQRAAITNEMCINT